MRKTSGMEELAKKEGFIAVFPEGTDFGGGRHAWNTGYLLRRQVKDAKDIDYLDALIDKLIKDHHADPKRIYMTGGSNGGMMTLIYAVERSERLAAVAPVVAAMFSFDKKPKYKLPILFIQGAKDDEVPIEGGMSKNPLVNRAQQAPYKPFEEILKFWVKCNHSNETPKTTTEGSLMKRTFEPQENGVTTQAIIDAEAGHGWPGRPAQRPGVQPSKINAPKVLWDFMKSFKRD